MCEGPNIIQFSRVCACGKRLACSMSANIVLPLQLPTHQLFRLLSQLWSESPSDKDPQIWYCSVKYNVEIFSRDTDMLWTSFWHDVMVHQVRQILL